MELRKLQASDLFAIVRILNIIGFKNIKESINTDEIKKMRKEIKELPEESRSDAFVELGTKLIFDVTTVVLEKLPLVETELYKFVGGLAGMKENAVAKMGANEFIDLIFSIAQKDEFKDFFKRASKLIK